MLELLNYGFFLRALAAGLFIAVACALLGVFLILRRDSMIGHGLSHVTFAGVALGLFLNILPLITALGLAMITALLIMVLKEKAGLYGDTAIAIFSSAGFALGIILVSVSQNFNADLFAYLFGEVLAISPAEVWLSVLIALIIIVLTVRYYREFMFMTFDRESAKVSGIQVNRFEILLALLTAATVVLGMKIAGLLLVSALLVIPSAAGLQAARSFRHTLIMSALFSVLSVFFGLIISFYLDFPASGTIVMISFLFFITAYITRRH